MCHDLSEHTQECVLLAIISHIFVGKIDWMHVSHVFMVFCLGLFALFGCFGNGIICYSSFSFVFFIRLGNSGMSKISFDECIRNDFQTISPSVYFLFKSMHE